MRISEVSWMTGDVRAEVTSIEKGREEEGEPEKDIIDFRTSEKIFFKILVRLWLLRPMFASFVLIYKVLSFCFPLKDFSPGLVMTAQSH